MLNRKFINRITEKWALIRHTEQVNTKLAVFVHGFRGDYLTTWGQLPTLLRDNATAAPFDAWDYLFLGYGTGDVASYLDIADIVGTKWNEGRNAGFGYPNRYTKLALFAHSLGTLGVRQLLCKWQDAQYGPVAAVHSVTLLGSPLNGSPWARYANWVGYEIGAALKSNNPQLRMLRSWWDTSPVRALAPGARLLLGTDDKVVGYQSKELMSWTADKPADVVTLDHSALVKPDSWLPSTIVSYIQLGL